MQCEWYLLHIPSKKKEEKGKKHDTIISNATVGIHSKTHEEADSKNNFKVDALYMTTFTRNAQNGCYSLPHQVSYMACSILVVLYADTNSKHKIIKLRLLNHVKWWLHHVKVNLDTANDQYQLPHDTSIGSMKGHPIRK